MTYQPLDDHCAVLLVDLPSDEYCHDGDEADQQADHLATLPRMSLSAVLQGQHVRHNQAHHKSSSDKVQLKQLLFEQRLCWFDVRWRLEEDEDDNGCKSTDGKVDPEALGTVSNESTGRETGVLPIATRLCP